MTNRTRSVDAAYIARRTGYSTRSITNWLRGGQMPPCRARVGKRGQRLWDKQLIDEWIATNFW